MGFLLVGAGVAGATYLVTWTVDRRKKIALSLALILGSLGAGGAAVADAVLPDVGVSVSVEVVDQP